MNLFVVQRIFGILLVLLSFIMLPPIGVSLYYREHNAGPFFDAFIGLLLLGALIWLPVRNHKRELRLRDGFLVVALFWVVLGAAGAVPLVLSAQPAISLTEAVFEAVAGFTTTNATILVGLDELPRSVLYYRHQMQWLGGIGMVVLAVALLPMLGIGGMQLLRAETPGPVKDARLTPRITETAKALWLVYVVITAACAACYWAAGMSLFDAIGHSFSTVSTGGFSSHDDSLGYFNNPGIDFIATFFMFLGAVNFSLHFLAWRRIRISDYFHDIECRVFACIVIAGVLLCTASLWMTNVGFSPTHAFRLGLLQATSFITTTGFKTDDVSQWPGAIPVLLILTTFIGGCAGSTASGMKVIRWLLMWKQGAREVVRLVHPNVTLPVKIGNKPVNWRILDAVWGFFAMYVLCFAALMVLLIAFGHDQVTAFSAIATCINNTGPGLGAVAENFVRLNEPGKWICIVAMLLGRLEVYPLMVLITPTFWRR